MSFDSGQENPTLPPGTLAAAKRRRRTRFAEAQMVLNRVENTSPGTTDAGEQLPTTFPNGCRLLSVQQWADDATGFSPEYCTGTNDYSAWQATGAPNVAPNCGDLEGSWVPGPRGPDPKWLQLSFPCAAYATSIQIYETYSGTKLLTYYYTCILSLGLYCPLVYPVMVLIPWLMLIVLFRLLTNCHSSVCHTCGCVRP